MSLSPASVVTDMLTTQDRSLAGPPLPSKHLTLEHVEYDAKHPLDTDAAADAASCSAGTTLPLCKHGCCRHLRQVATLVASGLIQ